MRYSLSKLRRIYLYESEGVNCTAYNSVGVPQVLVTVALNIQTNRTFLSQINSEIFHLQDVCLMFNVSSMVHNFRLQIDYSEYCLAVAGGVPVLIWKFCNPDPIRNFFMNSISNPYPKIKNHGLRYPIHIRNR